MPGDRDPHAGFEGIGAPAALDPPFSVGSPEAGSRGPPAWRVRDRLLPLDRPLVMGVLNLTPDSFSDGGELGSVDRALRRAERLVEEGADLLDAGGESTRPGAGEVPAAEEARRVIPFLEAAVRRFDVPLSVDTRKAAVARAALDAGVQVVNDVTGLAGDPGMAPLVAGSGAGVVLMHMRGEPDTMMERTDYGDLVADVARELGEAVVRARHAGIDPDRIVLDPGIGFAKTGAQNLLLLRHLDRLAALGHPVMVGPSRKRFLGEILGLPPRERVEGTVAACVLAYARGARIFRVHDVRPVRRALTVARAIEAAPSPPSAPPAGGDGTDGAAGDAVESGRP